MAKPTALTLFETVYPALVARFDALGGTPLAPTLFLHPGFRFASDDVTLTQAEMAMRRLIKTKTGRNAVVQIALRVRREAGVWVNKYAALHCGPDPDDMTLVYFRIDNETANGKHCHIKGHGPKPEKGDHTPFEDIAPPPTLDPYDFMSLVERFVATDEVPLKVCK